MRGVGRYSSDEIAHQSGIYLSLLLENLVQLLVQGCLSGRCGETSVSILSCSVRFLKLSFCLRLNDTALSREFSLNLNLSPIHERAGQRLSEGIG